MYLLGSFSSLTTFVVQVRGTRRGLISLPSNFGSYITPAWHLLLSYQTCARTPMQRVHPKGASRRGDACLWGLGTKIEHACRSGGCQWPGFYCRENIGSGAATVMPCLQILLSILVFSSWSLKYHSFNRAVGTIFSAFTTGYSRAILMGMVMEITECQNQCNHGKH